MVCVCVSRTNTSNTRTHAHYIRASRSRGLRHLLSLSCNMTGSKIIAKLTAKHDRAPTDAEIQAYKVRKAAKRAREAGQAAPAPASASAPASSAPPAVTDPLASLWKQGFGSKSLEAASTGGWVGQQVHSPANPPHVDLLNLTTHSVSVFGLPQQQHRKRTKTRKPRL